MLIEYIIVVVVSGLNAFHWLFQDELTVIQDKQWQHYPEEPKTSSVSKRQSLRSLLNSRNNQRGILSSLKENFEDEKPRSRNESLLDDKEETFVDRVQQEKDSDR